MSVEARDCPPRGTNQSFTIKPVGFKDYLEVSVDYQCDCSCSRTAQTNSSICSSIGTSSSLIFCSIFSAHFTWIYNHTTSSQITLDQLLVHSHLYDLKTGLNVFWRADWISAYRVNSHCVIRAHNIQFAFSCPTNSQMYQYWLKCVLRNTICIKFVLRFTVLFYTFFFSLHYLVSLRHCHKTTY